MVCFAAVGKTVFSLMFFYLSKKYQIKIYFFESLTCLGANINICEEHLGSFSYIFSEI